MIPKGMALALFTHFNVNSDTDSATMALDLTSLTPSQFVFRDAFGAAITFFGTGLTYGPTGPTGGLVRGFEEKTIAGDTAFSGSGFKLNAAALAEAMALVAVDDGRAIFAMLTRGNDTVRGSANEDYLVGGQGADRLFGAGGSDYLESGAGNDTMTGGAGSDWFFFKTRGDGVNVITDFIDTNRINDDFLHISRAAYRDMTTAEDANGVLLVFSASSSVYVAGWTLAEIGRDDFILI
ncbi:calcium-binding protein [Stagnihabitans tardus]|uniref:Calcium-binding protein n=1 Tax=Stagnihabitans tardus TaxID=2699202 RepID=A0AAE4YG61_9RHOB|nr:calcium-binding protein [Stagnihabitans tardus]NBZ89085.1 hypothetical protein [Stagnihabitans tardus]